MIGDNEPGVGTEEERKRSLLVQQVVRLFNNNNEEYVATVVALFNMHQGGAFGIADVLSRIDSVYGNEGNKFSLSSVLADLIELQIPSEEQYQVVMGDVAYQAIQELVKPLEGIAQLRNDSELMKIARKLIDGRERVNNEFIQGLRKYKEAIEENIGGIMPNPKTSREWSDWEGETTSRLG